uniref:C-type lectin domain-containing protein n=1 Tax=Acrobeloides nanus TaxID=290746 RepID=A0A914DP18_9BILA
MCQFGSVLPTIPASILNVDYQNLLEAMFTGNNPFTGQSLYPYYFGLHKNLVGVWSWYDYDQSEFPLSGFTKWGQGEPSTGNCTIMDSTDGVNLVWKTTGCDPVNVKINTVICQAKSCDSSSLACCSECVKPSKKKH